MIRLPLEGGWKLYQMSWLIVPMNEPPQGATRSPLSVAPEVSTGFEPMIAVIEVAHSSAGNGMQEGSPEQSGSSQSINPSRSSSIPLVQFSVTPPTRVRSIVPVPLAPSFQPPTLILYSTPAVTGTSEINEEKPGQPAPSPLQAI